MRQIALAKLYGLEVRISDAPLSFEARSLAVTHFWWFHPGARQGSSVVRRVEKCQDQ